VCHMTRSTCVCDGGACTGCQRDSPLHPSFIPSLFPCPPQSDKASSSRESSSDAPVHSAVLPEDEDYDARQALRFRRGLLDPRVADFRRSLQGPKDQTTWHVRCRVLGGGGEYFFPLEPSLVVRRPVYRVFLSLRGVEILKRLCLFQCLCVIFYTN
jgi:hypothetical protein